MRPRRWWLVFALVALTMAGVSAAGNAGQSRHPTSAAAEMQAGLAASASESPAIGTAATGAASPSIAPTSEATQPSSPAGTPEATVAMGDTATQALPAQEDVPPGFLPDGDPTPVAGLS